MVFFAVSFAPGMPPQMSGLGFDFRRCGLRRGVAAGCLFGKAQCPQSRGLFLFGIAPLIFLGLGILPARFLEKELG